MESSLTSNDDIKLLLQKFSIVEGRWVSKRYCAVCPFSFLFLCLQLIHARVNAKSESVLTLTTK